ncbi:hypothetical protein DNTS_019010 [Danionella cerebrum]|uniref:Rab3 GTPase-activating protein catalytic subunit n=1 Tax=Danionella cerebrum TaxID=2873325 RepID=A0A553RJK5_9TELE|nr:hypothetical protein DNTS_019010 [Danionella translucida]
MHLSRNKHSSKMAADSDPESEVFEITDFTTASEWERFISKIEEVLNDWKLIGPRAGKPLEKGVFTSGSWEESTQEISFADFKFSITHHYLKQEGVENEAKDEPQEGTRDFYIPMFGVREFVVLSPGANCEAIISESKCNLLLSSVSIALANSGCQVPLLVQIQQKQRKLFSGECQGPGVRTDFEMVHLRRVPSQYTHLSGLLDLFKSKIGCSVSPLPPIRISIRFTYVLQDWQQCSWPQQPPDFDALLAGEVGAVEFGKLPFGACEDPVRSQYVEHACVSELCYSTSDLDPLQAPHWSVRIRKAENPQCLLGEFLMEFFRLCSRKETTEEILGRSLVDEDGKEHGDITQALSKLTEPTSVVSIPKLSVSSVVRRIRRHRRNEEEAPLNPDLLSAILTYLFPDAAGGQSESSAAAPSSPSRGSEDHLLFSRLKSAPALSLTQRLAVCVCVLNLHYGGVTAVAQLWQEFVLEMRYRWEHSIPVSGLPAGAPDLRCCLLHQKLQMLNCCIERRKARDDLKKNTGEGGGAKERSGSEASGKPWSDSWSDSEDEFYECVSDTEEMKEKESTLTLRPEGRLEAFGDVTLLDSQEPLYIPDPAPMTEDLLEQHSEVLARLGSSAEGAQIRARMQSASLLSDMEAFKAANPGCSLLDFVRWYSPRDFVEVESIDEASGASVKRAELSARMQIPGNMWAETWETATHTPARRQRRLFDDTREAEKVLHYLSVQKPADLAMSLLPCVLHTALIKLKEEEFSENISSVRQSLQQITSQTSKLVHQPSPDLKKLEDVIGQMSAVEALIARSRSLKAKFGIAGGERGEDGEQLVRLVSDLLEEPEVCVVGAGRGPAGSVIHKLFSSSQRSLDSSDESFLMDVEAALLSPLDEPDSRSSSVPTDSAECVSGDSGSCVCFPPPVGRELLLRACAARPAPGSRSLPQRLFCSHTPQEFRLAGAFSSDTSFF